jgi:SAM-dependent methyltransferase
MDITKIDDINKIMWGNELIKHILLYPSERVVAFLGKNYPDAEKNNTCQALDIGSGSGRHIKVLLEFHFQTYGIDYTDESCDIISRQFLQALNFKGIFKADLDKEYFEENFFDVIICWGVMFLRPTENMLKDLQNLYKILQKGGKLLVNFRTKDNWFYGKGETTDTKTFFLNKDAGPYTNMTYTFLDKEEAGLLLNEAGFKIINTEREELWKNNCSEHHSWWVFWAEK